VIVAVVVRGRLVGVVVAVVVNAGVVVGASILADVTDVTVPSWPRAGVAGPYSAGIEASCEWKPVSSGRCWRLNNASSFDRQADGSVVAFPLEYSPEVNQSVEQVDCYAQLSTNVVDLKLFIKYV
jgi:hypothetical protein